MEKYTDEYFDEIFGTKILDSPSRIKYECFIELSINYPPTKPYERMTDEGKKILYDNLLLYLKKHYPIDIMDKRYEYGNKTGKFHVHTQIRVMHDRPFSIEGTVMDIVRIVKEQLPKRYQSLSEYGRSFTRYKDNQMCCQYVDATDNDRQEYWQKYIKKNALKIMK